jgi:hypothetical protein
MKRAEVLLLFWAALATSGAASARPRVVVELFTAQGCSSCGAANAFVDKLADRPGVIALTWSVDYWDYLGWKDTFAKPEFADRQRVYDKRFGLNDVYTPQVVVDGEDQASGDKSAAVETLIRQARLDPVNPPDIRMRQDGRIAVGSARRPRGGAEVWLIRYDPREQEVEVRQGDNRGKTVPHRNVVRQVVLLGPWTGHPTIFKPPAASEDGLTTLVVVQGVNGGRILGVEKLDAGKV